MSRTRILVLLSAALLGTTNWAVEAESPGNPAACLLPPRWQQVSLRMEPITSTSPVTLERPRIDDPAVQPISCRDTRRPVFRAQGSTPTDTPPAAPPDTSPDLMSAAPSAGTAGVSTGDTQLIGDLTGFGGVRTIGVQTFPGGVSVPVTVQIPRIADSVFKITENENPRPTDRLFVTYNYYSNVSFGFEPFDLHRETFGFEKTFLQGNASVGLRVPFLQQDGDSLSPSGIGDLNAILKFALINDEATGNLLSAGLAVTFPTASEQFSKGSFVTNRTFPPVGNGSGSQPFVPGSSGATSSVVSYDIDDDAILFQPFVGFIYKLDRFHVQGFTTLVLSSEQARDPVLLTNALGIGYRVFQNECQGVIRYVTPTLEVHVTTPLSKRGNSDQIVLNAGSGDIVVFPDIVSLTGGIHVGLCRNLDLTVGVAVPVTGPRPFDVEATVQLNVQF